MNRVEHVCWDCLYPANSAASNPARTDWCAVCGHRGEGQKRLLVPGKWGRLRPVPLEYAAAERLRGGGE
jgi:hypothetical protein